MGPLPFYSLVRTGVPGSWVDKSCPLGLGVVVGRSEGFDGWYYAVMVGELCYDIKADDLVSLGWMVDRKLIYGLWEEFEAVSAEDVILFVGPGD